MGKKRENIGNWITLLKYKKEYFDLQEFENYNKISANKGEMTRTPYIKNKKIKEVGVNFLTGKENVITRVDRDIQIGHFTTKSKQPKDLDEKTWLKKSVNIFNSALLNRTTVVLEKNDDKVKLSIFKFSKSKQVGYRYFKKYIKDLHVTFNLKTKNFFITESIFHNRKRRTSTTKNDFSKIVRVINSIKMEDVILKEVWLEDRISGAQLSRHLNTNHIEDVKKFFNKVEQKLTKELDINFNLTTEELGTGLGKGILKWFVKIWKIKVPNHYYHYLLCHYPGIRNLRKHKMNLGRAVLANKELQGKYYIKLINEPSPYNLTDLKKLERLLGASYAKMVPKQFLRLTSNYGDSKYNIEDYENIPAFNLTKYEKLNLIKVMGDVKDPHFLSYVDDHLNMKTKLKSFGMNVKIKCKKLKQFNDEHSRWANLVHLCERNKSTTYCYDVNFIETMEKPITKLYKDVITKYEIKVLKTDLEYFNEGQYQHHCVRNYLDRYDSIIISIRREGEGEFKRMTVEFDYGNKSLKDYRKPRLVQAQMKYNQNPTREWEELINELKERFTQFKNLKKPTIEIYNKITDKKIIFDREKNETPSSSNRYMGENIIRENLPF